MPFPVNLGSPDDQVLLLLYATGVRGYATGSRLEATIGGIPTHVSSVEALSELPGIDRLAFPLPHTLVRRGDEVGISVDGFKSNRTLLAIQ